ncbi:ATP-dependent helicase [Anaeromyxobacter paludicola]|uniref:DNA 3'-5' helicase n=1 Tax=Anaeromyxobacter paludicola TaxID=2918171 RepID=A0ABN6NBZ1_9BACT|nr:UvrD-helicase domain-containing protein [Anaeromyxobacter paludicola]BDG09798.1 DNA helicase [Anaeromyxobacter paludicola]
MSAPDLLQDLNDAQAAAVLHGDGPLLVLAGAGSGKTRVIVHRIAHLVTERRVMPWHVLAVTFTNKAAGEMRERLEALLGPQARELWLSTFHAFGARFLRREAHRAGLPPDFAIYDDDDQLRLVKSELAAAGMGDDDRMGPRAVLTRIDRWKSAGHLPGGVKVGDYDVEGQAALEIYRRYEKQLARAGAVDFGDLLLRPLELLESDPDLLRYWSGRFRYLLVDEFQDTSAIQLELVKLLAGAARNVCVVGDDDQAIYRWRGADVSNILDFDRTFPGTRVVKLEQNYRSTSRILEAAHAVIAKAARRREKKLWTAQEGGAPLRLLVAQDEHEEGEKVARAAAGLRAEGVRLDEIAVLYRTNAQSRPLEAAMRSARLPYVIVRGQSFYERAEVKDAAAYLRLALNPRSDLDLARVINRPARGIGEKTVERLRAYAAVKELPLIEALGDRDAISELKPAARKALAAFHDLVLGLNRDIGGLDAGVAVQEVLTRSEMIEKFRAEGSDEGVERVENLLELVAAAREFDEAHAGEPPPRDPEEQLPSPVARFLEQLALLGDADAPTPEGRVALMTLHAAKGLEFDAVFMAGMEDGTLPYERPWSDDGPAEVAAAQDEERRLCYVGMTRAKKLLTLSLARRRMGFGENGPSFRATEPSRFLGDLPPELFGLPARAPAAAPRPSGPVIRRHPGALPGEPVIELDEADGFQESRPPPRAAPPLRRPAAPRGEPEIDYSYDQSQASGGGAPFPRGARVVHPSLGEGVVKSCDGAGAEAKVTVAFFGAGEKRVLARFLRPG